MNDGRLHVALDLTLPLRTRGGTRVYATELARALGRTSPHRLTMLARRRAHASNSPPARALNALSLTLWLQHALPARLARLRADVLHCPAFLAPLRSPCPVVVSIHDTTYLSMPHDRLWGSYAAVFARLAVHRASAILTFSESTRRDVLARYDVPPARVAVVPHGVGSTFQPQPDAHQVVARAFGLHGPYLLFVGTSDRRKNLPVLVRAFARLRRKRPNDRLRLVLVGAPGNDADAIRRATTLADVGRDVVTIGWASAWQLPSLYAAATCFVFPSLHEGFGLPVLEAMACGVPVVASNRAAVPEVAGDAALLVDTTDEAALASAIERVLDDATLREDLRTRGFARAEGYSWARSAALTTTVYERVARMGRSGTMS